MKKLFTFACGLSALMMVSCSSDEPANLNTPNANDGDVYATLSLKLPASTRADANNGIEVGQDYENSVGKILVILAEQDASGKYKYLTSAYSDAQLNSSATDPANTLKYSLTFKASDLNPNPMDETTPGSSIPGKSAYVFVYCNPTATTVANFANLKSGDYFQDYAGEISDKDNANIWKKDHFLMTNCEIAPAAKIPSRTELVANHNVPEKAFNLGTVKVKRVCARFDFATTNDNKYEIKDNVNNKVIGEVELTDMAMFNIQRKSYYLPRTADSWSWNDNSAYTLCGDLEGYVMSVGGDIKNKATLSQSEIRNNFFSSLTNNSLKGGSDVQDIVWTSIKPDVWNQKPADTDEGWSPSENTDYRIWRYTTENTLPAAASGATTSSQRTGITTGVVFKGEFNPTDKSVWNGHVIYLHNDLVFGDLAALKAYVDKYPETQVAADFKSTPSLQNANVATDLDKNLMDGLEGDQRHGFKAYAPTDGKYIVYYFYYNRHLTNNNNSLMGTNEFGVVRNNVYKLKVTAIGRLGEPKSPNDPGTPDEEENAYFSVSCLVMPWTVRVNNIEF